MEFAKLSFAENQVNFLKNIYLEILRHSFTVTIGKISEHEKILSAINMESNCIFRSLI